MKVFLKHSLLIAILAVVAVYPINATTFMLQQTNSQIVEYYAVLRLQHDGLELTSITWSPDGSKLATASRRNDTETHEPEIYIWDVSTGERLLTITDRFGLFNDIAWSPDGRQITAANAANYEYNLLVWDASNGEVLATFEGSGGASRRSFGEPGGIRNVDWSPDSTRIITTGYDGKVDIWSMISGQIVSEFETDTETEIWFSNSALFSPSGDFIASLGQSMPSEVVSPTIKIWDAESYELSTSIDCMYCRAIMWNPTGSTLLSIVENPYLASSELNLWDVTNGDLLESFAISYPGISIPVWNPTRNEIAGVHGDVIQIWDASTFQTLATIEIEQDVRNIAWSPDGTQLAVGHVDGTITIWEREEQN